MRISLLLLLLLGVTSLQALCPVKPFDGDPQKARNHIASGKAIESYMVLGAIEFDDVEVLKVLFDEGKVPTDKHLDQWQNHPNNLYLPPLHEAAMAKAVKVIHYLVGEKKVNLNFQEPTYHYSAGHWAISGKLRHEALEALLQYSFDITLTDFRGQTVEDRAREFQNTKALELLEAYKNKQKITF